MAAYEADGDSLNVSISGFSLVPDETQYIVCVTGTLPTRCSLLLSPFSEHLARSPSTMLGGVVGFEPHHCSRPQLV